MSLRDLCDVVLVIRVDAARQMTSASAIASAMGGADYVDPVAELYEELDAKPVERHDDDLRRALGLRT